MSIFHEITLFQKLGSDDYASHALLRKCRIHIHSGKL